MGRDSSVIPAWTRLSRPLAAGESRREQRPAPADRQDGGGRASIQPRAPMSIRFRLRRPDRAGVPPPGFGSVQWIRSWMTGLTRPPGAAVDVVREILVEDVLGRHPAAEVRIAVTAVRGEVVRRQRVLSPARQVDRGAGAGPVGGLADGPVTRLPSGMIAAGHRTAGVPSTLYVKHETGRPAPKRPCRSPAATRRRSRASSLSSAPLMSGSTTTLPNGQHAEDWPRVIRYGRVGTG